MRTQKAQNQPDNGVITNKAIDYSDIPCLRKLLFELELCACVCGCKRAVCQCPPYI
jgi:hypothetical protein